jgi:enoyl-CoA hydratase
MDYQAIATQAEGPLGIVTLRRPEALNALNGRMAGEIVAALDAFEGEDAVRCVIVAGTDKVFCAGADIREMAGRSPVDVLNSEHLRALWEAVGGFSKPIIAAISGYALGGGLELAMCCDIIVAAEGTKVGQPEIGIGLIPGGGGTQRLSRAVGKYKAMEMIMTGATISAEEARSFGLVNIVVQNGKVLEEAKRLGREIAAKSPIALKLAKKAVARSEEEGLSQGLEFERELFYLMFATRDSEEGMKAFLEKRKPVFTGE